MTARSTIRSYGLTRIALAVRDPKRVFQFYDDVFDAVALYQKDGFIQAQTPSSRDVIVFEKAPEQAGSAGGIIHFGFRLTDAADIERAKRAVEAAEGTVLSHGEFCPGEPYLFCRDPDGYEIEIWYELPTAFDPQIGLTKRCSQRLLI